MAFHGRVLTGIDVNALSTLRVYKRKTKQGEIDRVLDPYTVIGRNLFRKETDLNLFVGLQIIAHATETNQTFTGTIEGPFGTSGKVKIKFKTKIDTFLKSKDPLTLPLKRYIFDKSKTQRPTQ